ncbi:DedA family protein/thiosulfate sulfurtransferase GlpE [Paracidobacterium acidisoli]|uniref:Rhodanese domain-containing protein n=1 Tax=Paracidobacterium acidisoli TaxID=2303751 RepID=A0A372IP29_9BACT|nr:DedA family protein/thiosulfate sulfurtransferase GlpE [Paracidobacterium acidisoli]MBT9331018.1 DedA family protein/thiosulfate sulfurtransferase GlpE [Paracidobacterium acidisoli]
MPVALDFFIQYGYLILFLWVLTEQIGIPVPSMPIMITAGTLTATHKLSLPLVLLSVMAGSLISDSIWYFLGKRFGGTVVKVLCRLSMESSTCVRKTEGYFTKNGEKALLLAKFIPGLGTVAAPIAGQINMRYSTFAFYDAGGVLLWALAATLGGRFFGDVLKRHPNALSSSAQYAGILFIVLFVGFLVWRVLRQRAFLKEIRMARLEPQDLKGMLDHGREVFIVDLRHPLDYLPDPRTLPGAMQLTPDKLVEHSGEIPRDRDVVLFCTCPSEATAAKMALALRKMGIYRVRPLRGGFDEWKRLGYPLVDIPTEPLDAETSSGNAVSA